MLTLTKEQELLEWCQMKKVFSYVDINDYKTSHYYLRADRQVRDFVVEGKLRKIPHTEALLRRLVREGRSALAWFEIL